MIMSRDRDRDYDGWSGRIEKSERRETRRNRDQNELERDEEVGLTCVEKLAFLPFVTRIRHGYSFSLSGSASSIVASSPS